MRTNTQNTYGAADVLELRDIHRPDIADDEVLNRVHAVDVHRGREAPDDRSAYPGTAGILTASPQDAGGPHGRAQHVEPVCHYVTRFRPGDAVPGIGKCPYGEYPRAPNAKPAPKPASPAFVQAPAVPIARLTAVRAGP